MPAEIELAEIRQALGQQVEVTAFGIPYVGTLAGFDENLGQLTIRDAEDQVLLDLDRIESFKILTGKT